MVEKNLIKAFIAIVLVFVAYNMGLWLLSQSLWVANLGELKVLKEKYPNYRFEIIVCHAVNIQGLKKLCDNFDHVTITNSYCDYEYQPSNNNLTVIDVCK